MRPLTLLIPTYDRNAALAVLLTSLYYQAFTNFSIIIADQSDQHLAGSDPQLHMLNQLLRNKDMDVTLYSNLPRKGMAQQRQFLLDQCDTPYCLYLDDDLVLEPWVIGNLMKVIKQEQCGFVGNAVIGLGYREDHRPHQQHIEFWEGLVTPETLRWGTPEWQRYELHNAANLLHVQQQYGITASQPKTYKVAWCGGCVLYDRIKLDHAGGFRFWQDLPENHCGEDVMAQWKVMERYGGCGVIPSGAYHQELTTTVEDRRCNAPQFLTHNSTYAS